MKFIQLPQVGVVIVLLISKEDVKQHNLLEIPCNLIILSLHKDPLTLVTDFTSLK